MARQLGGDDVPALRHHAARLLQQRKLVVRVVRARVRHVVKDVIACTVAAKMAHV
jgi:hypothetical protein